MSRDNQKARELRGDGLYYKVQNEDEPLNSQEQLYEEAYKPIGNRWEGSFF